MSQGGHMTLITISVGTEAEVVKVFVQYALQMIQ